MIFRKYLVVIGIAALSSSGMQSTAMDLGTFEYMNSCASCHGADGKGDGPIAQHLHTLPPDLTMLSANNDGVFPVNEVYAFIDGSADVAAHGGRDMPVWGARYRERAELIGDETADFPFDPALDSDVYVRARILMLIEYLSTLQAQ